VALGQIAKSGDVRAAAPFALDHSSCAMTTKLFLGGLTHATTSDMLREHFGRYGTVVDCVAMNQGERPRGFGFVDFAEASAARRAASDTQVVDGRCIDVKPAMPRGQAGTHKIFVGGLTQNVNADMLRAHFGKFGQVMDVVVLVDRETNRSRGFGFIRFAKSFSVDWVIRNRDAHFIDGKWAEVKRAVPSDHMQGDEVRDEGWDRWERWAGRSPSSCAGGDWSEEDWSTWESWSQRRTPFDSGSWWGKGHWDDWCEPSWTRYERERFQPVAPMAQPEYWLGCMMGAAHVAAHTAMLARALSPARAGTGSLTSSPVSSPNAKFHDFTPSTVAETPSPVRSTICGSPPRYSGLRKEVPPMGTLLEDEEELVPSSS